MDYLTWALSYSFNGTPLWKIIALAYCATTGVRLVYCAIGRFFGFYNPNLYRFFLWLPWRPIYNAVVLPVRLWWEEMFRFGKKATARWASIFEALTLVYKPGMIFLGRLRGVGIGLFQPVGIKGERHLVMIAGTGSGKTTQLITMLGLHTGSSFVIDPKGQITKAIAERMGQGGDGVIGKGGKVCILDPYHIVDGWRSSRWNPFDEIDRALERHGDYQDAVRYAMKFAEALITRYPSENPFWPGTAKDFLLALILHIHTTEPPARRNLGRFYEMLSNGIPERTEPDKSAFGALLREMSQNQAYGGAIAASANSLADTGNDTFGNVLITMREQLKWMKLPQIRDLCETSDFHLQELKTGNLNLFICAPVGDVQEMLAGYFRLITVLSFYVFEDTRVRIDPPCLFAIDEMPSLGKIDAVATSAPLMRSYGVRLLAIAQDIEKLKNTYPDAWGGFLGNAEAVFWMGLEHEETISYLSKRLGENTFQEETRGGHSNTTHVLMNDDQLRRFLDPDRGNLIVTRYGKHSLKLKTARYYKELPVFFYTADREYAEAASRAGVRAILSSLIRRQVQEPRLDRRMALHIFGLSERYSRRELDERFNLLKELGRHNAQYVESLRHAQIILRESGVQ